MVALLGAGAMGVDVGFTVYGSRTAQAMADTAALDLARYINVADSLSTSTAVQTYLNGKLAEVTTDNAVAMPCLTATPGVWQRCVSATVRRVAPDCTSVPGQRTLQRRDQVTATQTVPQIFWGGFSTLSGHTAAQQHRVAVWTPEAGFSIGSYLASFDTAAVGGAERHPEHARHSRPP